MRRVLVMGSGGAGKTVFARRLAALTGLPLIHLDAEYWQPGWVARPPAEWAARLGALVQQPSWILDGSYGGSLSLCLAACDTVIFLDMPRWLALSRLIKRRWQHRGRSRPELPPGCPERLRWDVVVWVRRYRQRARAQQLLQLAALGATKWVVRLRTPREVERFLVGLTPSRPE